MSVSEIPAEDYHADLVGDRPSLSSSIIYELCERSLLHAWTKHPRLNPKYQPEYADYSDIGTLVHALILEGTHKAAVFDFPDWRTKEARQCRAEVRGDGRIPILRHKWDNVQAMVLAIQRQLKAHADAADAFTNGKPEETITWEEDGTLFRSRLDWLHDSHLIIDDLKTTGISANPATFTRQIFNNGLDIQAALYRRGVKAVFGVEPKFRFIVAETEPPYALSVIRPDAGVLFLAEKKIAFAKDLWRQCLASGVWEGYPDKTLIAELPEWEEQRWLKKELESVA